MVEHDLEDDAPPDGIERSPPSLLNEPLEFLFAEHYRQRQMCRILEHLAATLEFKPDLMRCVDDFIRYDLALHVIDEEADLFPMLRRRCAQEDDVDAVLGRLAGEHALDQQLAGAVRVILSQALAARIAPSMIEGGAETMLNLARQEKSHMALENAVVMPLARRWLTRGDLATLSARFALRRGVTLN